MPESAQIEGARKHDWALPLPVFVAVSVGVVAVFAASLVARNWIGILSTVGMLAGALAAWRLYQAQRHAAGSVALIVPLLLMALWGGWSYGSFRAVTSVGLLGAVVVAGIFVGRRALAATMACAATIYAVLIYAERSALIRDRHEVPGIEHWLAVTVSIVLTGLAVHYAREVAVAAMKIQEAELRERRVAEQDARIAEERLRLSMEATRQGWFDVDLRSGAVVASAPFVQIVSGGDSPPEMTLQRWIDSIHRDDREAVVREYEACLRSTQAHTMSYRLLMATREWRWIRSIAKVSERDDEGRPIRLTGTHADITKEHEAEQAMAESEARYRAIVDHTPVAIAVHRDGKFIYANPAVLAMLRAPSPEALIGRDVIEIVHPDDRAMVVERVREAAERGRAAPPVLERILRTDGSTADALVQNIPILFEGRPAIQVSCLDMTDLNRAERQLRDSERQLTLITDTVPGFLAQLDTELRYLRVNRRYEQGVGFTSEQLRGRTVREVFGEADWAKVRPHLERAVLGETVEFETRMSMTALRDRWIRRRATPAFDEHGHVTSIVIFGEDITAEKDRDAALLRAAKEFQGMLEATTDGFLVIGVDERVLAANDAVLRMLGYTREELMVRSFGTIDVTPGVDSRVRYASDASWTREALFERKDGSRFPADVSSTFVAASGRMLCFVRDISERRRTEELRLRSQKLESLGTLAGGIAHDFNNILSAIRGNVELVGEALALEPEAASALAEIDKAGARATELVRRITAFGRPKEPKREAVHLPDVVSEVFRLLRPTTPARIDLRVHYTDALPPVLADASQVHEALVNLTTNATHAIGGAAGVIDYRMEAFDIAPEDATRLRLTPGRYVRLSVVDNGHGMDADTMARVFDVFFTTKMVGEGTGLGLSMVHGIMQSHMGAVAAESAPGKGASFHLYFPVANPTNVTEALSTSDVLAPEAPPRRVLFVDDEAPLVRLAERSLGRQGHSVTGFSNPVAALDAFCAHPDAFDILITDLSMPQLTGLDLAKQVRKIRPDMPVLLVTGYLTDVDEAAAHAAGIFEVLGKAQSVHHLARAVNRVVAATSDPAPIT